MCCSKWFSTIFSNLLTIFLWTRFSWFARLCYPGWDEDEIPYTYKRMTHYRSFISILYICRVSMSSIFNSRLFCMIKRPHSLILVHQFGNLHPVPSNVKYSRSPIRRLLSSPSISLPHNSVASSPTPPSMPLLLPDHGIQKVPHRPSLHLWVEGTMWNPRSGRGGGGSGEVVALASLQWCS
jgi:hypothetical protein